MFVSHIEFTPIIHQPRPRSLCNAQPPILRYVSLTNIHFCSSPTCRNQSVAITLAQSLGRNQSVAITLLQSTFSRASLAGVDQPDPAPLLQALLSPHALQALLSPRRASCERTGLQQRTQLQADLSIYDDLNLRHQAPMSRGKPHYLQQELECGPVRKAPSSLFTMAVSPGTVALVACGLLPSLGVG